MIMDHGGDFVWPNSVVAKQIAALRDGMFNVEHFTGDITATRSLGYGYLGLSTLGGSANMKALGIPGAYGCARIEIPDDASGAEEAAGARQSQQMALLDEMFGTLYYSARIQIDDPPAAGQEYSTAVGLFQPESAQRVSSDGAYWLADESSAFWQLISSRAGAQTIDVSTIEVATSAWQTLEFEIDVTNGIVTGLIDGEAVAEVEPPNVQPSQNWGSEWIINGAALSTRANPVRTWADWLAWGVDYAA